MSSKLNFGEDVPGYEIPVLNEREIRAAAGMLFLLMFIAILKIIFTGDFILLKYAITIFLSDMLIRVFISPKYSPMLIIARWIVRNQTPEYVGALQKKFAWNIGIALGVIMMVLQVIVNSYSPITGIICFICLIFLFFESAFGICLGCKIYPFFNKSKLQHCPGEVCELKDRHEIQKMNYVHIIIVFAFLIYISATSYLLYDFFKTPPFDLLGIDNNKETVQNLGDEMKLGAFSVSLAVKDINLSKEFYEILGFKKFGGDITQNWLIMKNGDHTIGLFQGMFDKNILTFNPGWDQDANSLHEFDDVREIQKELKSKGIKFDTEADENSEGPGSFIITDPDGNVIMLDQHI